MQLSKTELKEFGDYQKNIDAVDEEITSIKLSISEVLKGKSLVKMHFSVLNTHEANKKCTSVLANSEGSYDILDGRKTVRYAHRVEIADACTRHIVQHLEDNEAVQMLNKYLLIKQAERELLIKKSNDLLQSHYTPTNFLYR